MLFRSVGKAPHGLAMQADGKTLLVGVYGEDRVAVVDLASLAIVATIPADQAFRPLADGGCSLLRRRVGRDCRSAGRPSGTPCSRGSG